MTNLKYLRKKKGVTQKEVADYLGIVAQAYGHYETGRRQIPAENIVKLADYFGVSIDELLGHGSLEDGRQITDRPELVPEDEVMIPLVASLRCGPDHSGEPFTYIKPVPIPASYVRRWGDNLQAIIAVGESMSPNIIPGDLLICRPGDDWSDGNVVVVNVDDSDMVKRIYTTKDGIDLRSDNPAYQTIHISHQELADGRLHVLGRVLIPIGKEL